MNKAYARRQFLGTAAAATAGWLGRSLATDARAETSASSSQARLFAGCCAYSFSKYLESKRMSMEDFILKGVEMGVQGVDITTYWLKSTEPAYLASLRQLRLQEWHAFFGRGDWHQHVPAGCGETRRRTRENQAVGGRARNCSARRTCAFLAARCQRAPVKSKPSNGWWKS